jgi:hypothetical protein
MVRRMSGDLYLYMITGLPMLSVYDDDTVTDVRLDVQTNVRRSLTCVKRHVQHLTYLTFPSEPCLIRGGRRRSVCGRRGEYVCQWAVQRVVIGIWYERNIPQGYSYQTFPVYRPR